MKEMIKSKGMVCFILFILGVSYFNTSNINKIEKTNLNTDKLICNNI